jgi:hypothetical protein
MKNNATPPTPVPRGYTLLPADAILQKGDKYFSPWPKKWSWTDVIEARFGQQLYLDVWYIRPTPKPTTPPIPHGVKLHTPCCNYKADPANYPVYYNPFNKVVQCHNCGQQYSPKPPLS